MKISLLLVLFLLRLALSAQGQGTFWFYERTAPTRIGSIDGPLATSGFWGQALVGLTVDSLTPLGTSVEHRTNGHVVGPVLTVPFVPAGSTVFVQMAAWDGTVWGTSYAGVPANQLGYTDIVPVFLVVSIGVQLFPEFMQPAIVPIVPEPAVGVLAVFGGMVLFVIARNRRRERALTAGSRR